MNESPSRFRRYLRKAGRILLRLSIVGAVLGVVGLVIAYFYVRSLEGALPDVHKLKTDYHPPQVTRILGRDGSLLAEMFTERRTVVSIKSLPSHVILAFVAAEDAYFFEHEGLNYSGILRAVVANVLAGRKKQGGSTITQQVVKNVLLEDPTKTYERKIKEALLSRKLEQELGKEEILELYLNHIYFGGGRYGIEEAAKYYFGKSAKDLTLGEAALLGGLPKGPEIYSPRNDLQKSIARRGFVLEQMAKKHFLDRDGSDESNNAKAEAAKNEPVRLAPIAETQSAIAPEVVEIARKMLKEVVGEGFSRGGYTVQTTIDPHLQASARKAVRDNLRAIDKRTKAQGPFKAPETGKKKAPPKEKPFEGIPKANELHKTFLGVVVATHDDTGVIDMKVGDIDGTLKLADLERYNPAKLSASAFAEVGAMIRVSFLVPPVQSMPEATPEAKAKAAGTKVPLRLEAGPQSALVALDVRGREVLALVGSYEGVLGGLDRATQMRRQPGSTFKPLLYSYAIHSHKVTAATLVDASAASAHAVPRNVNGEDSSTGMLRLREGLAGSVNGVALRVMADVGPQNVIPWAKSMGITSNLGADLSLALGSYEVSPFEMAGAYGTFAGGGVYAKPVLITKILGPDGHVLPMPAIEPPRKVMDENEAYVITNLLTSVIDHGTGTRAKELRRPVAGKTGTTNQAKDTWFIGYTTDVVCAVWTGYDDPRPIENGSAAGATTALPAWLAFMKDAHEKKPAIDWPRPSGVSVVKIDPASGLRAYEGQTNAMDEVFLVGTEPAEIATPNAGVDGGDAVDGGATMGADPNDGGIPTLPSSTTPTPALPTAASTAATGRQDGLPGLPP